MKKRPLGRTGLSVSEIALGCSGFWGHTAFPEKDAEAVIREAHAHGINFFDTGHHYCNFNAEPRLGRILRPLISAGAREGLVISSKVTDRGAAERLRTPWWQRRPCPRDYGPDYVEGVCAAAIRNLGCGYLDVFQLHGIREHEFTEPLLERLERMKERGMFRCLGVNTHSESLNRFVARHADTFGMSLIDFNVLQLDREPVIDDLSQAGVGVVAGTVLAQGHLIPGKIGRIRALSDVWYLARARLKPATRRLGAASARMRETLAAVNDMSPAQAAVAYVLANPNVASCVFGTTRVSNLAEIAEATDRRLRDDDRASIRKVFESMATRISE